MTSKTLSNLCSSYIEASDDYHQTLVRVHRYAACAENFPKAYLSGLSNTNTNRTVGQAETYVKGDANILATILSRTRYF